MKQQDIARASGVTEVQSGPAGTGDRRCLVEPRPASGKADAPSAFTRKLSYYADLTATERDLVAMFERRKTTATRGEEIRGSDDPAGDLFVVASGWLTSHTDLPDGRRQTASIHLPGDLVGLAEISLARPTATLQAVEPASFYKVPKRALIEVMRRAPRLIALLVSVALRDQAVTGDLLRAVGRMTARERIAYLLLDLHARLRITDDVLADTIRVPLTQFHIADHLGMTNVYASLMMIEMEKKGWIVRRGREIALLRRDEMAKEVDFHDRYAELDTSWYPGG